LLIGILAINITKAGRFGGTNVNTLEIQIQKARIFYEAQVLLRNQKPLGFLNLHFNPVAHSK
jgi:hypothetical protein